METDSKFKNNFECAKSRLNHKHIRGRIDGSGLDFESGMKSSGSKRDKQNKLINDGHMSRMQGISKTNGLILNALHDKCPKWRANIY